MKNNFQNLVNSKFKIIFLFLIFSFSFISFGEEKSFDRDKNYFISQSMKFGNKPLKNIYFSAADQHAIVLSANSSLEIIKIQNGKKVRVIPSREQGAISLVPHPGGKLAITGGEDETIRIWDTLLTSPQGILRGHLSPVSLLTLNTGGEILASSSFDGTIILWNLMEQTILSSTKILGKGGVKSLVFHPEKKFLVVGGKDGSLQFRSVPSLNLIFNLPAHKKSVTDIEFNNRGDIFVTCSEEGEVIIWDWKDKKSRFVLNFKNAVADLEIHPRRQEMAVGTEGGEFETWNLENGTKLNEVKKFEHAVSHLEYDNNGERILTALDDGSIHIWEYRASMFLKKLTGHERTVESMDFSKNSNYLISSGSEKSVFLWDLENEEKLETFDMGNHRVQKVRFIPKSLNFITAGTNGLVKIWDSKSGKLIRDLIFHKGKINSLSVHPEELVLLSAGSDRNWALWDIELGKEKINGSGHSSQILASTFSRKGDKFATAGSDLSVIVWSFSEGEELVRLNGHKKAITSLAFSPDDKFLASGSMDNRIILWKLQPEILKNPYRLLEGHEFIVNHVFFSNDGEKLISVSKDKTMRLWDVKSGKLLRILHGGSTPLVSAALSPNGELIALSSLQKDILLFKFSNEVNEFQNNFEANVSKKEEDTNFNDKEFSDSVEGAVIIDLDDLQEQDNNPKSEEELSVYSVPILANSSSNQIAKQNRLNHLLNKNSTCHNASEIEEVSLDILKSIPDDLAAYHSLAKVSIMRGDFNILRLLLMAGNFARLDNNRYDYLSLEEVKTFIEKFKVEVFDQSFSRRGNIQKLELVNCSGKSVPFILSDFSQLFHYPKEFLEKITKKPRLIDLRDFMELDSNEFQNRMFVEIDRVIQNPNPHHISRISRTSKERSASIPFGKLKINFEKVETFKDNGIVSFLLRKEGDDWRTYFSDMDNQIIMHLQAGRYYLKVSGILRKTFTMISGTDLSLNLE